MELLLLTAMPSFGRQAATFQSRGESGASFALIAFRGPDPRNVLSGLLWMWHWLHYLGGEVSGLRAVLAAGAPEHDQLPD